MEAAAIQEQHVAVMLAGEAEGREAKPFQTRDDVAARRLQRRVQKIVKLDGELPDGSKRFVTCCLEHGELGAFDIELHEISPRNAREPEEAFERHTVNLDATFICETLEAAEAGRRVVRGARNQGHPAIDT